MQNVSLDAWVSCNNPLNAINASGQFGPLHEQLKLSRASATSPFRTVLVDSGKLLTQFQEEVFAIAHGIRFQSSAQVMLVE